MRIMVEYITIYYLRYKETKNEDKNYEVEDKKIFAYILAMKHLIADQSVWDKFFINLQQLIIQYNKYIELNKIGFPENWIEILSKKS